MGENGYMNDYELLYLIHQHSDEAMELLLKKHERMIWSCIHHYYYRDDSDHSEIYQRCLLSFHRAVLRYRDDGDAGFATYLRRIIEREIIDYVRRYRSKQKLYELEAVSLDQAVREQDSLYLIDCVENNQPAYDGKWMLDYQNLLEHWQKQKQLLNDQERQIWDLRAAGRSYDEISEMLGITKKKVDNTLQKIRRNHKRVFD